RARVRAGPTGHVRHRPLARAGRGGGGGRRPRPPLRLEAARDKPALGSHRSVADGIRRRRPLLEPRPSGQPRGDRQAPALYGHRLLEQMLAFFVQHATEERMLGLYAEAVTVHPFSQKSNLALGAAETGVQLADEAPVLFKQIADNTSDKRTATVLSYFKTNQG